MKSFIVLNPLLRGETNVILKVKMFSMEEKKLIVREFAKNSSPEKVRRVFICHYHIRGRVTHASKQNMFSRVRDNFEKIGSVWPRKPLKKKTKRTQEAIQEVKEFIEESLRCSLRTAEQQTSISKTTLWRMLRYDSNFYFYYYKVVQSLIDVHKEQRENTANGYSSNQTISWTELFGLTKSIFVSIRNLIARLMEPGVTKTLVKSVKPITEMISRLWFSLRS